MRVVRKYIIHYINNNVYQTKNLIKHEDYVEIIKPLYKEIISLESEQTKYGKKNKNFIEIENKIKNIKKYIKEEFGEEFFTDESPIYISSLNNGIMILPEWQGGKSKVELKVI